MHLDATQPRRARRIGLARTHLSGKVCISVGGAFDLISGARRYAPAWMQRAGLTWLHRLSQEPRRLGPRYLHTNSQFIGRVLLEIIATRILKRLPE